MSRSIRIAIHPGDAGYGAPQSVRRLSTLHVESVSEFADCIHAEPLLSRLETVMILQFSPFEHPEQSNSRAQLSVCNSKLGSCLKVPVRASFSPMKLTALFRISRQEHHKARELPSCRIAVPAVRSPGEAFIESKLASSGVRLIVAWFTPSLTSTQNHLRSSDHQYLIFCISVVPP